MGVVIEVEDESLVLTGLPTWRRGVEKKKKNDRDLPSYSDHTSSTSYLLYRTKVSKFVL